MMEMEALIIENVLGGDTVGIVSAEGRNFRTALTAAGFQPGDRVRIVKIEEFDEKANLARFLSTASALNCAGDDDREYDDERIR